MENSSKDGLSSLKKQEKIREFREYLADKGVVLSMVKRNPPHSPDLPAQLSKSSRKPIRVHPRLLRPLPRPSLGRSRLHEIRNFLFIREHRLKRKRNPNPQTRNQPIQANSPRQRNFFSLGP